MLSTRFQITLTDDEHRALMRLADDERRATREQASIIVRDELRRRGLLGNTNSTDKEQQHDAAVHA